MIALTLIILIYSILAQYDYDNGKGPGKTGKASFYARLLLFPLFSWLAWLDIQNWLIAAGFIAVAQNFVWHTFTGMLFYRKFFKTGETKKFDKFFKFMPDIVFWGLQAFVVLLILTIYYNNLF